MEFNDGLAAALDNLEATRDITIVRFDLFAVFNDVINDPGRTNVLTDIRYSMLPTGITPMWGIDLNVASDSQHATFEVYRDRPDNARELFVDMLFGQDLSQ